MQFEIDDTQIEASAKKELEIAVSGLIKDTITGYQFTAKLRDRVKELANSCLDKVAHDLIQEMKPRMREMQPADALRCRHHWRSHSKQ